MKLLLLITLFLTTTLFANFNVGDKLPDITLLDQFNKKLKIEENDALVIMAFEKDTALIISDYLKAQPASFLLEHQAKYISDISAMPSFISSVFALPKMKKYPFSIMLINDDFGKQFNHLKGKVTIFKLKKQQIKAIDFISPETLPTLFKKQ